MTVFFTQTQVNDLRSGFDSALTHFENALANKVFAQSMPLIGAGLQNAFNNTLAAGHNAVHEIRNFRDAVVNALQTANLPPPDGSGNYTEVQLAQAINQGLSAIGYGANPVSFNTATSEWSFNTGNNSVTVFEQGLDQNLGMGPDFLQLAATSTGSVDLDLDYSFSFTAGSDAAGFYVRTDGVGQEISLGLAANAVDISGAVQLGSVHLFDAVVDNTTSIGATFALNLVDGDGKLHVNEFTGTSTQLSVTGGLDFGVNLQTNNTYDALPSFGTNLDVDWNFAVDSSGLFGSTPTVTFTDTELNFGTFIENVLKPFVTNIQPLLNPLRDVFEVLNSDIGFLHQVPGAMGTYDVIGQDGSAGPDEKVTLLDFAAKAMGVQPVGAALVTLQALSAIADFANFFSAPFQGPASSLFSIGDFSVTTDIRSASFSLSSAGGTVLQSAEDLSDFITLAYANTGATQDTLTDILGGGPGAVAAPILTQTKDAFAYLFGQNIDLVKFDLPTFGFSFGGNVDSNGNLVNPLTDLINIPLGIIPGLNIEVEGGFAAAFDLDFGYDTRGLLMALANNFTDTSVLANGFYISDYDSNGQERPEIRLSAQINFGLGLGIDFLAKAFAGGHLQGDIFMDLIDDGVQDGKVHLDEFASSFSDPLNLFEGRGMISASLLAYATFLGTTWQVNSDPYPIANFNFGNEQQTFDPGLASFTQQGNNNFLILHTGPSAFQRHVDNTIDGNEQMSVSAGSVAGEVIVSGFGFQQEFSGVTLISGLGGDGNDTLSLSTTLMHTAFFYGNNGDDLLSGGAAADRLEGGANSDILLGNGGDDYLLGQADDDVLIGGAGADNLDGGSDTLLGNGDTASYSSSAASVTVNLTTGAGTGGDAQGDVLANIENLVGADVDGVGDVLTGDTLDTVAHTLSGLKGNDTLIGGGGDDRLIGGEGNDILDGGAGNDTMTGGVGNDTYVVDSVGAGGDVIDEDAYGAGGGTDRIKSSVDINIEALTDIEELQLIGAARIGEGNLLDNLIIGSGGADTLRGFAGADTIQGGNGIDTLDGGTGADTLEGGGGNDTMLVDNLSDTIVEIANEGSDTVRVSVDGFVLTAGAVVEILATEDDAASTARNLRGNAFGQAVRGNLGDNVLEGAGGADAINGGAGGFDVASYANAATGITLNLTTGVHTGDAAGDSFVNIDGFAGSNNAALSDTMTGGTDSERFDGMAGNDFLYGNGGADQLFGGLGNDYLDGGIGNDTMAGGSGDDTYIVNSLSDVVNDGLAGFASGGGGGGYDTIRASIDYSLAASADRNDIEALELTDAARVGTGNALNNRITGTTGNDVLDGLTGADDLRGGQGDDDYYFDSTGDVVVEGVNQGHDQIFMATSGFVIIGPPPGFPQSVYTFSLSESWAVNVEDAILLDDVRRVDLIGNALGNRLVSNNQTGTLTGLGGNDTLVTGRGQDIADGGADTDTLVVDWSAIAGSRNFFTIDFAGTLAAGYSGMYRDDIDSGGQSRVQFSGIEHFDLKFGDSSDTITTGDGNDSVAGGSGDDAINTATGNDTVDGQTGNDRWIADQSARGAGEALVLDLTQTAIQMTYASGKTVRGIEMVTLTTGAGNDVITTTSGYFADNLTTGLGNDTVKFVSGRDFVDGGVGTDTLIVDWSAITGSRNFLTIDFAGTLAAGYSGVYRDDIDSGGQSRVQFSGIEHFDLKFGASNDTITTGDGNDKVAGGEGNDFILTGLGADIVDGQLGVDRWHADKSAATTAIVLNLTNAGTQNYLIGALTGSMTGVEALGSDINNLFKTGSGRDIITTRSEFYSDFINTGSSNDRITVAGGKDVVDGGTGTDTLIVDWSAITGSRNFFTIDFLGSLATGYSGMYRDDIDSGGQSRVQFSGIEHFDLKFGDSSDTITTGDGNDSVAGGSGDDAINTATGNDTVDGQTGNDRWIADQSARGAGEALVLDLTQTAIQMTYASGKTVRGIEMVTLTTGAGNDVITTTSGYFADNLTTGLGNDTVKFVSGRDFVDGGVGTDTLIVDWSAITGSRNFLTIDFAGTLAAGYSGVYRDDIDSGGQSRVQFAGIEHFDLKFGASNDTITTGDGNDKVAGGEGNDFILTGLGADIVDGQLGVDRWHADKSAATTAIVLNLTNAGTQNYLIGALTGSMTGVEALGSDINNLFKTGSGQDIITTRSEFYSDFINTGSSNDRITVAGGKDVVDGGTGTDTLIVDWSAIAGSRNFLTIDFAGTLAAGYSGMYRDDIDSGGQSRVQFSGIEHFDLKFGDSSDTITTGDGNDSVAGGSGDDAINTATGNDTVDGQTGNDRWIADQSARGAGEALVLDLTQTAIQMTYASGKTVRGIEMVTLTTGAGNDVITTTSGYFADNLTTGLGNDTVKFVSGRDFVDGGVGTDTLIVDWSAITGSRNFLTIDFAGTLAAGYSGVYRDDIDSGGQSRVQFAGIEHFDLKFGASNDTITTGDGNDKVAGGEGNDFILTGLGADIVDGQLGVDRWHADKSAATTAIVLNLTNAGTQNYLIGALTGSMTGVEALGFDINNLFKTGSGRDIITTRSEFYSDFINTGSGNDRITVAGGQDVVDGGTGTDTLIVDWSAIAGSRNFLTIDFAGTLAAGYSGMYRDDIDSGGQSRVQFSGIEHFNLKFGDSSDTITTGDGNDVIDGGAGNDTMTGGLGNDIYVVDSMSDNIVELAGGGVADRVKASASFTLAAGDDVEYLQTTDENLTTAINLTGNELAQTITGNAGDNVLNGGIDDVKDVLAGGYGDDTYIINSATDNITEYFGRGAADRAKASVSFALVAGDNIEFLETIDAAATTAINLTGNNIAQTITGNAGANILNGGVDTLRDTLIGGLGDDTYVINTATDIIVENAGQGTADRAKVSVSFTLAAGVEIEFLETASPGLTTALALTGNEIAQTITGNRGDNILNGGRGNDILTGGVGSDTFRFDTTLATPNSDVITDFNVALDSIELENAIFTLLTAGAAITTDQFRNLATGAQDATDVIIYDQATGNLFYDSNGLTAGGQKQFAQVTAGTLLTNLDFLVT